MLSKVCMSYLIYLGSVLLKYSFNRLSFTSRSSDLTHKGAISAPKCQGDRVYKMAEDKGNQNPQLGFGVV